MRFHLVPKSSSLMTLNCFKLSRNFALVGMFGRQQRELRPIFKDCRALTFALAKLSCSRQRNSTLQTLMCRYELQLIFKTKIQTTCCSFGRHFSGGV